ncbi:S-type anion channel SLAH2-like isoform X1 [Hibiscus syriacus]|uniref:S-type anion channel SLAH2-like isoform X1 n=1 Tax=Hibiscus syriacus TaxID=106335 RepID=UPI0019212694|nr:S-type anion channel SLAH2-like isoform X1 [Hibiscus syriacus]
MDNRENHVSIELQESASAEPVPDLLKLITSNEVVVFDTIMPESETSVPSNGHQRKFSISISMPSSPTGAASAGTKNVLDVEDNGKGFNDSSSVEAPSKPKPKGDKFLSQPMPKGSVFGEAAPNIKKLKDKRFNSFKTWSGRLERQLSNLRGRQESESESEEESTQNLGREAFPVDRYFNALEGPELETLRASEEIVLPDDKTWPFLLRYPISSFGICLGVSSQAVMWKTLATATSTKFLHISLTVNLILWWISIALVAAVSSVYLTKVVLYLEAVRREYYHPIRVNFFFAPWIVLLFLALGVPPSVATTLPVALWYVLMTPFLFLELKIYGQWMLGDQRRLSKVANPTNHLSVVGNFVGALLGASMGLKEGPIFFFAVGLAHYTVLFVTLNQRLPTNETLPKDLHPVFFLFVAAPSVASMAWANIQGSFDYGSRITYFIALFLYFSLVSWPICWFNFTYRLHSWYKLNHFVYHVLQAVRVNFFRGFKFSLAWWAYTFPMTSAAIASMRYSSAVTSVLTQTLSVILSVVATLTVTALLVTTIVHAFVLRDLFPNDIAIAISDRKPKPQNR